MEVSEQPAQIEVGTQIDLQPEPATVPSSSESRLRAALTQTGSTTDELKSAVLAVEALFGDAWRDLQSREFLSGEHHSNDCTLPWCARRRRR